MMVWYLILICKVNYLIFNYFFMIGVLKMAKSYIVYAYNKDNPKDILCFYEKNLYFCAVFRECFACARGECEKNMEFCEIFSPVPLTGAAFRGILKKNREVP